MLQDIIECSFVRINGKQHKASVICFFFSSSFDLCVCLSPNITNFKANYLIITRILIWILISAPVDYIKPKLSPSYIDYVFFQVTLTIYICFLKLVCTNQEIVVTKYHKQISIIVLHFILAHSSNSKIVDKLTI